MRARLISLLSAVLAIAPRPAFAGPPFITDDPEPVDERHWEVNYAVTGTFVQGGGSGLLPQIDANYGPLRDVQIHVQPQFAYVQTPSQSQYGLADTELGVKYRFIEEDEDGWVPMVGFYPLFEVPTGNAAHGLGNGVGRTLLPIWIQKGLGKWTVYGGAGYWIDPGANGKDALFAGGVALYQLTELLQLGGEFYFQGAEARDQKNAPGFNLGGTYKLTEDYRLLFSAGSGLANRSTTNRFSAYLALQVLY